MSILILIILFLLIADTHLSVNFNDKKVVIFDSVKIRLKVATFICNIMKKFKSNA